MNNTGCNYTNSTADRNQKGVLACATKKYLQYNMQNFKYIISQPHIKHIPRAEISFIIHIISIYPFTLPSSNYKQIQIRHSIIIIISQEQNRKSTQHQQNAHHAILIPHSPIQLTKNRIRTSQPKIISAQFASTLYPAENNGKQQSYNEDSEINTGCSIEIFSSFVHSISCRHSMKSIIMGIPQSNKWVFFLNKQPQDKHIENTKRGNSRTNRTTQRIAHLSRGLSFLRWSYYELTRVQCLVQL
eukprot:TRINITY_DN1413_c1_g1_i1.p1 TRINITY_DN1413_c1_g1~~TRINITY_DN1413_c1_g1_i1.p1  ORF type:complete len:244 (+),score=-14.06 TRINITY_DN1413_c1_g1_i1:149-880(+)